ncbi:MAG: biotin/lipoyl-binding protein [Sulfuricurvum sp.]
MNNAKLASFFRFAITFAVLGVALFLGLMLWDNYMNSPWTRDGRVRADVVMVAPDVGGLVTQVDVTDNQHVKRGDILYRIDPVRFEHALHEAQAQAMTLRAEYEMKRHRSLRRAAADDETVSGEERDDSRLDADVSRARYDEAMTRVETAKLDLERSIVRAPSDGWVSNLLLRKGDYVAQGDKRMALVTEGSFWVYGYFEEHKLSMIAIGDPVEMKVLGTKFSLKGHVESIARGISDRDNVTDGRLLANVNPIFTWIRLAQRIPVRIHIDEVPKGLELSAGMTCSVIVKKPNP